jgi:branched-subunit amino acid ABC-type transport system permease component
MTALLAVLVLASVLVLATLGLHLTFGMLGLVNLTHGAMLLCGGYAAYVAVDATGSALVGLAAAICFTALLGMAIEVVFVRRLYDRPLESLVVTFGLTAFIRQSVILLYGPDPRGLHAPIQGGLSIGGATVARWDVVLMGCAVLAMAGFHQLLVRTRAGLECRAAVADDVLAATSGVRVRLTRCAIFAGGSAVAGLAGALVAPKYTLDSSFGLTLLVYSFFVVMLARPGSLAGLWPAALVVAGVVVGLQYVVSPVLAQVLAFAVILMLIRVREPALDVARAVLRWRADRGGAVLAQGSR